MLEAFTVPIKPSAPPLSGVPGFHAESAWTRAFVVPSSAFRVDLNPKSVRNNSPKPVIIATKAIMLLTLGV